MDRAPWAIEDGKEPVAGGVDLLAAKALELTAYKGVMLPEQLGPGAIPEFARLVGRPDEIGEEDRREHAVRERCRPYPGQELLDLVDGARNQPRQKLRVRSSNQPCARDRG